MTTNDFGSLAEERDRTCARLLYHSVSLVREASREWVVAELKELSIEADRLLELVGTAQRNQLSQLTDRLKVIETTAQSKFSKDESVAFEAARNEVFAHVHEPAQRMLREVNELEHIMEALKNEREKIEDIARTVGA